MNGQSLKNDDRYPIAERNRRAKMKFLVGVKDFYDNKKTSIELRTTGNPEMDLSIPGTPVSSKYLSSLPSRQLKAEEQQKDHVLLPNEIIISSMVIDKFLADMKTLDSDENYAEVTDKVEEDETKVETKQENATAEQYFLESEQMRMYQRTFSQAVQTLHSAEVKSPLVKRYFEESSAKQTYSRDFEESCKVLDPTQLPSDQLDIDSTTITKGYKTSVPGTPIDSKHLNNLKLKNYISDSSDDENDDEYITSKLADPLDKFIRDMEQLKAAKYGDMSKIKNDTSGNISSEVVQESSEVKQPEIDSIEQPLDLEQTIQKCGSLEELLGKFQPLEVDKQNRNEFCVDEYMNTSDDRRTYARTFSEAAQLLHSTDAKNPNLCNYFEESDKIKSFKRGFSEVYQEIGKQHDNQCGDERRNEISVTCSSAFDRSAATASTSNECVRNETEDISIPGTPINSRKICPKDKTMPTIEAKRENGADRPEVDKSIPERNGNVDREFWKNFGAASL
ncbi:uncharacterized protein LOC129763329 [Toxorhynchites rutilus septentrionalis]|uniref:uncharacterized protein LOC129763329 n=1 Tax=Toxorhynchites rutilus septentrionalis TaxID=329112 RepID=UPI00247B1CFD|nr:uncharacterized protein LOC129763329 [Toxorhynchites rutilus septentrionalis]